MSKCSHCGSERHPATLVPIAVHIPKAPITPLTAVIYLCLDCLVQFTREGEVYEEEQRHA